MPVASRLVAALAGAVAVLVLLPVTGWATTAPLPPIVCPNGICVPHLPVPLPPQPVPVPFKPPAPSPTPSATPSPEPSPVVPPVPPVPVVAPSAAEPAVLTTWMPGTSSSTLALSVSLTRPPACGCPLAVTTLSTPGWPLIVVF